MRLQINGWHRLFLILIIIVSIPLLIITIKQYPDDYSDLYLGMEAAVSPYPVKIKIKDMNILSLRKKITSNHNFNYKIIEAVQAGYSDEEVKKYLIDEGYTANEIDIAFEEEEKILNKLKFEIILSAQRKSIIYSALSTWTALIISMYLLGWATGWVYRGFNKKP